VPKVIGPRVYHTIRRRKYRPWFKGERGQDSRPEPPKGAKPKRKRCRDDFESSESEADHTSFKRIRLVSPGYVISTERKRKKVRLYGLQNENKDYTALASNVASLLTNPSEMEKNSITPSYHPSETDTSAEPGWDSDLEVETTEDLTSEFTTYENFEGRRYHGHAYGATYLRPNDDKEQDNELLLHAIMCKLLNARLHVSIHQTEPSRILDLGTGTGIWAMDSKLLLA